MLAAGAAAALLAGCGGSQLSPQGPASGAAQAAHSPIAMPMVKNHCPAHGGVRVGPCRINLTASSPGPDNVFVRTPKSKKATTTELDTCSNPGIATVTQGSGHTWIVTAGTVTGSCTAEFDYLSKHGKKLGWAVLSITNSI